MTSSNRYSYDSVAKAKIYIALVFFGALILLFLFMLVRFVIAVISGAFFQSISEPLSLEQSLTLLIIPLTTFFVLAFLSVEIAFFANFEPEIKVSEQGLHIQFFLFWWRFVPWGDIEAIRPTITSYVLRNSSKIVLAKTLTPIHYSFGLAYAFQLKPGFLIRRRMRNFDQLCQIIEAKIHPTPKP